MRKAAAVALSMIGAHEAERALAEYQTREGWQQVDSLPPLISEITPPCVSQVSHALHGGPVPPPPGVAWVTGCRLGLGPALAGAAEPRHARAGAERHPALTRVFVE